MTFEKAKSLYYKDWKTRLRKTSYNSLTNMIDNILKKSHFPIEKNIKKITENDIVLFKEKALQIYTSNSVYKAMSAINNIFDMLEKRGILKKNVTKHLQKIKQNRYKVQNIITVKDFFLLTYEISKFKEKIISKKEVILFLTLLFKTGLRHSEARSLRWDNINFEMGILTVTNSLYCNTYAYYELTETKTMSSKRSIHLDKVLLNELKEYHAKSPFNSRSDFIFCRKDGIPRIASFGKVELLKAAKKIGVKINTHGLRHSHASFLLQNQINILKISRRLGHSSIEVTLKIYCHLLGEDEEDIMKLLENI